MEIMLTREHERKRQQCIKTERKSRSYTQGTQRQEGRKEGKGREEKRLVGREKACCVGRKAGGEKMERKR